MHGGARWEMAAHRGAPSSRLTANFAVSREGSAGMLRSPNVARAALLLLLAVPDANFVSAQAVDAPALRPPARQLKTDRRLLDGAAAPVSNMAAPSNVAAPKSAAPKAAALAVAPKATAPALASKAAAPTTAAPSNATSKPKRAKVDKPKRARGEGRHGMPTWLVVTMCLLGLAVPIGLVVLLMLYKRRQEAAGAGGSSAPVSTKEPWAHDDDDDAPDSPRPDPYASAFAGADDDEENAKL